MGKWMDSLLEPDPADPVADHIPAERLARLAEGDDSIPTREDDIHHLNRCPDCFAVLSGILKDQADVRAASEKARERPDRRRFFAVAASVLLVALIGGGLFFHFHPGGPRTLTASLEMDADIRNLLSQAEAVVWTGERVGRLAALLRERGVAVSSLGKVVLSTPYIAKKDLNSILFGGPKETLKIRIEGDTAYLTVMEEDENGKGGGP